MRKFFCSIFIALLTIGLNSCAIHSTPSTNKWLKYELPPSMITQDGKVFFEGKLSDGSTFSVFTDQTIAEDADYYGAMLRQDFGWQRRDSKTWTGGQNAREIKLGYLYINPNRRVAVYYYPDGKYKTAFKVKINE